MASASHIVAALSALHALLQSGCLALNIISRPIRITTR